MNAAELTVPFERVATMVSQLTHDVRNGFNAMELQAAYVADLLTDPEDAAEAAPELKRLRGIIADHANTLRRFSARFRIQQPARVRYPAKNFIEDFRQRLARVQPDFAPEVTWHEELADEAVAVDPEMIFAALGEFFQNAAHFQEAGAPVTAWAGVEAGRFCLELRERKTAVPAEPATWGVEPLVSTRDGGYGLGIFHARRLLAAHGGGVQFTHDAAAAQLTTRVFLPLAA